MLQPKRTKFRRVHKMKMKGNAWEWYQRRFEDQLSDDSPPIWRDFRQVVMDEFLALAERRRSRAAQFEKLRQAPGVSVEEYAREFIRLSKYAPYMMPTEAVRMDRFRASLITPLYNLTAATKFLTLSRLIDKAK